MSARGGRGRPRHPRGTSRQTPSSVHGPARNITVGMQGCQGRLLVSARGGRGRSWKTPSSRQGQGLGCQGRLLVSACGGHGRPRHPRGTARQTPSSLLLTARGGQGRLLVIAADPLEPARHCPQWSGESARECPLWSGQGCS